MLVELLLTKLGAKRFKLLSDIDRLRMGANDTSRGILFIKINFQLDTRLLHFHITEIEH